MSKSTQGIAEKFETSLGVEETLERVFARDSELEREELSLNEKKKSYRRPSDLELKLQKLI